MRGVREAFVGCGGGGAFDVRGVGAQREGITRSALLSGYLGKSGHLPRSQLYLTFSCTFLTLVL